MYLNLWVGSLESLQQPIFGTEKCHHEDTFDFDARG